MLNSHLDALFLSDLNTTNNTTMCLHFQQMASQSELQLQLVSTSYSTITLLKSGWEVFILVITICSS